MPLAWFSKDANEVYHVCLDCEVHNLILPRNLRFRQESHLRGASVSLYPAIPRSIRGLMPERNA